MKRLHDIDARSTLDHILELVVLLGRDMEQSLAREGLTVSRAHLLWLLHHGGPAKQRALAEALEVSPRNVTGLVDGLVATGFVTREPDPVDRRAVLVSLTRRGKSTLTKMDEDHGQLARHLFGGMSERQFAAFSGGVVYTLDRLREALASSAQDAA